MDGIEMNLDLVCKFLDADEFGYRLREDAPVIDTGFKGRTGTFPVVIFLRDDPLLLGILVRIPEVVPESKRAEMADATARANYGLSIGCFELDMSSGDMTFRASIPISSSAVTYEQFRDLMRASLWTTDRYHRAFCRLLYNDDLSPAEVIAEVEMADD